MKQFILLAALAVAATAVPQAPQDLKAITRLFSPTGEVQGNITFTQVGNSKVLVEGIILGLPQGQYGFHVHEKGDITGGCLSTGGHFNPENKQHGHPNDIERHVGDLGNVEFDESRTARVNIIDEQISLIGPHGVLGRAVVLHERNDDYGRGTHPDSRKTGNAGGRVACGVIGILNPVEGWSVNSGRLASASSSLLVTTSVLASLYLIM